MSIHKNCDLLIFQHNHVFQGCWKNTKPTFQWIMVFQSKGPGPDSWWKYGKYVSCIFFLIFLDFVPWIGEKNTSKCWFCLFPTTLTYMVMLQNCLNNISMCGCLPIQGTTLWFRLKFYEARISECNLYIMYIIEISKIT